MLSDATRAVIERLLNALEEETSLLNKCRAREGDGPMEPMPLVAEARKLLEEPASEDAWLSDVMNDVVTLCELHSRAVMYQTETLHSALMERREKLKERLRARPAKEQNNG